MRVPTRRVLLIEAMVLLRDWPLVLVMCVASFVNKVIALGPPVLEKNSEVNCSFSILMTLRLLHFLVLVVSIHFCWGFKTLLLGAPGCQTRTSKNADST